MLYRLYGLFTGILWWIIPVLLLIHLNYVIMIPNKYLKIILGDGDFSTLKRQSLDTKRLTNKDSRKLDNTINEITPAKIDILRED